MGTVDKTGEKCPSCEEEYNAKKNPATMCNFCGAYCCMQCMPTRKRPHPLSKDGSGKRYNICQRCDTKYLNLQLSHVPLYHENRVTLRTEHSYSKPSLRHHNNCSNLYPKDNNTRKSYQNLSSHSKKTSLRYRN